MAATNEGKAFPGSNAVLLLTMLLASAVVAALAYWDAGRESAAALDDFAREQAGLAQGIAVGLQLRRVARSPADESAAEGDLSGLLTALRRVESPGRVHVYLVPPGRNAFVDTALHPISEPALERGVRTGARWVRLDRPAAKRLGLPERTAIAGLSALSADAGGFRVAVVATAEHERDRAIRANVRLLAAIFVTVALVLAFGGAALRKQRSQLELQQKLVIAKAEQSRDERLVQADKLATLGALAMGIAHEVSTPLGVILGRAEQVLDRMGSEDRSRRAVEVIIEQTDRISQVVRGFLGLARGASPRLEHVVPEPLVRHSIELVAHRFEKAQVQLLSDVPAGLPRIACEPRLFEQVLVNLLLNACDACRPGGHVELAVQSDGERVSFVVTDDGHGIDEATASRVTRPFFTTKPLGEGSGLGLAIASEIVQHHHGTLVLEPRGDSRPPGAGQGPGTRAVVEVPIADV